MLGLRPAQVTEQIVIGGGFSEHRGEFSHISVVLVSNILCDPERIPLGIQDIANLTTPSRDASLSIAISHHPASDRRLSTRISSIVWDFASSVIARSGATWRSDLTAFSRLHFAEKGRNGQSSRDKLGRVLYRGGRGQEL